jgi:hypothetical protein
MKVSLKLLASIVASAMGAWNNNFNKLDEATKFAQVCITFSYFLIIFIKINF